MDIVEAKRNIEKYETEITKWQALSRGLMSRDEAMFEKWLVKTELMMGKHDEECF